MSAYAYAYAYVKVWTSPKRELKETTTATATGTSPKRKVCTCVINLCTFRCLPLPNNNVKWPSFAYLGNLGHDGHRKRIYTTANILDFLMELTAGIAYLVWAGQICALNGFSYSTTSALNKIFFGLYKIWQGKQLFAKKFWTHCEYLLESLILVTFTKPNKHKMRSEGFSTTWPNFF